MDSPSMHAEAASAAAAEQPKVDGQVQCRSCPALFKPRKKWQHFCSTTCRNAFHTEEKRKAVVRQAGPLPEEGGASLKAAGFKLDKDDAGGSARMWHNRDGRTVEPVGNDLIGGKWRWAA